MLRERMRIENVEKVGNIRKCVDFTIEKAKFTMLIEAEIVLRSFLKLPITGCPFTLKRNENIFTEIN